jgi:hypothetical protein
MSDRKLATETRTIHPLALDEVGEKVAIVMLGVARDLRSGVIPPEDFNMQHYHCGSAHCIGGWIEFRVAGRRPSPSIRSKLFCKGGAGELPQSLCNLFSANHPSDPHLAARAIERYVYKGSIDPWVNS